MKAIALSFAGMLLVGCGSDATAPSEVGTISLLVVSGGGQSGVVGTELPQPLVIKATNSKGRAIADLTVNFRVTSGGGSMFAGVASTDNKGMAADYWTLGTSVAQQQSVEVRAVLSSGQKQVFATFTAVALPGMAAHVTIQAGNGQSTSPGTAVSVAPAVQVTDQYGNSVPNNAVTFIPGAGSGSVTGGAPTTDALGIASVGSWILGSPGINTLIATAAGSGISGNPVTFTATGVGQDLWVHKADMPSGGRGDLAASVMNSLVYAVGGFAASGYLGTVEAYDPTIDAWTIKSPMLTPRAYLATGVVNDRLYALGGQGGPFNGVMDTVEVYDPLTDSWTRVLHMPTERAELAVGVVNGVLYAVGGRRTDPHTHSLTALGTVEAYDPVTGLWTTKAPMPTPR
ncbi:MAG TPA: kelch repeat-containing protein, partial [Gemmatimonadales bacterium]